MDVPQALNLFQGHQQVPIHHKQLGNEQSTPASACDTSFSHLDQGHAHEAFARLQAQSLRRAGQRCKAVVWHASNSTTPMTASGNDLNAKQRSQDEPSSRRLHARVTTTAGRGMQREAPSRSNSRACSVRSSQEKPLGRDQWDEPSASDLAVSGSGAFINQSSGQQGILRSLPTVMVPADSRAKPSVCHLKHSSGRVGAERAPPAGTAPSLHSKGPLGHHHHRQAARPRAQGTSGPAAAIPSGQGDQGGRKQQLAITGSVLNSSPSNRSRHKQPDCLTRQMPLPALNQALCLWAAPAPCSDQHLQAELGCGIPWQQLRTATEGARIIKAAPPGGNLQQRRHMQQSRQATAHLVAAQWRWFALSRRTTRTAEALHRRRLLLAAWQGLSQEVEHMRLLAGRAHLHVTKHAFMLLSRTFISWQQVVMLRKRLESASDTLEAHRHRQTLRSAVFSWQQHVLQSRQQRSLLLRAEAFFVFMTMLRVLQQWRAHTTQKQVTRLRVARAEQHWRQVVCRHVLMCWQDKAVRRAAKWQLLARALCFHKHKLSGWALGAWAASTHEQREAHATAVQVLQHVAQQLERHRGAAALCAWLQAARMQAGQRQLVHAALASQQRRRQQQVLQRWHGLVQYHQQLAAAAEALQQCEPSWWRAHSFARWRGVTQVLRGQRGDELQMLVQLRACLGTWLKYTERRQHKAWHLAGATGELQRLKVTRLVACWLEVAAQQQHEHQQVLAAQQHYHEQLQLRVLLDWQQTASEAAVEALQSTAAARLYRLRLLTTGIKALSWYCRYCRLKRAAPDYYLGRLVHATFTAWRQKAADKQQAEQQRRTAIRHFYLSTTGTCLQAWQLACAATRVDQQQQCAAQQHHKGRLLTAVFQAWHGPVLQHVQHKHQQQIAADTLARHHRQLRALSAWSAAVTAGQHKRTRLAAARQFRAHHLLSLSLQGFLALMHEVLQERSAVTAAAAPAAKALAVHKQRHFVRAWLAAAKEQQSCRAQVAAADGHARQWLQSLTWKAWLLYLQHRRSSARRSQVATTHNSRALMTGSLAGFRQQVAAATHKRKMVFAAALHRRRWLLSRGFKAWRLCAAVTHMEAVVLSLAPHQLVSSTPNKHSSAIRGSAGAPQRPQQASLLLSDLQSPAADVDAVVEASCAGQRQWQQQWRVRLQQALTATEQQPLHVAQLGGEQQPQQQQVAQAATLLSVEGAVGDAGEAVGPAKPPHQVTQLQPGQDLNSGAGWSPGDTAAGTPLAHRPPPDDPLPLPAPCDPCNHTAQAAGSAAVSSHSRKRALRPQPRLPSFMLQQQPLGATSSSFSAQQQQQQQQQQQLCDHPEQPQPMSQGGWGAGGDGHAGAGGIQSWHSDGAQQQLLPFAANLQAVSMMQVAVESAVGMQPMLGVCVPETEGVLLNAASGFHAAALVPSPTAAAVVADGASWSLMQRPVTAVECQTSAAGVLTWQSPQVGRKARLRPRQLRAPAAGATCLVAASASVHMQQQQAALQGTRQASTGWHGSAAGSARPIVMVVGGAAERTPHMQLTGGSEPGAGRYCGDSSPPPHPQQQGVAEILFVQAAGSPVR